MHCLNIHPHIKCYALNWQLKDTKEFCAGYGEGKRPPPQYTPCPFGTISFTGVWERPGVQAEVSIPPHEVSVHAVVCFGPSDISAPLQGLSAQR
jgi:hypothetical protein